MPMPRKFIDLTKTYHTKTYGDFIILEELAPKKVPGSTSSVRQFRIKFIDTGYEKIVTTSEVEHGSVRDPYAKTCCGVGYIGELSVPYTKKEYDMWFNMLKRCYVKDSNVYKGYGALGITVDPRWFCFANFLEDLPYIDGYQNYINDDPENMVKYAIDKDIKQKDIPVNQRVYSKDTCTLIYGSLNARYTERRKRKSKVDNQSKYKGLYKTSTGNYQCSININGSKYFLGLFDDEIAAANMYNIVFEIFTYTPGLNDVPRMDIKDVLRHRTSRTPLVLPEYVLEKLGLATNDNYKYIGVYIRGGRFVSEYSLNGMDHLVGSFDNDEAAAVVRDAMIRCNHYEGRINTNTTMSLGEAISHSCDNIKTMCVIFDKKRTGFTGSNPNRSVVAYDYNTAASFKYDTYVPYMSLFR